MKEKILKSIYQSNLGPLFKKSALVRRHILYTPFIKELWKLEIVHSVEKKIDDVEFEWVVLKDGTNFLGQLPQNSELKVFAENRNRFPPCITDRNFRVAKDIVTRYIYPHAMPHITLPYPRWQRYGFHPQHKETISEIKGITAKKKKLIKELFKPKIESIFFDVGAYLGYGSIRMAQELGKGSILFAVEADPMNQRIIELNLENNNISNVILIPRAIWNVANQDKKLAKNTHQANSLIENIVTEVDSVMTKTTTVDNIFFENNLAAIDMISLTVNGAEIEAVEGMKTALNYSPNIRISAAGWYKRNGKSIAASLTSLLIKSGLQTAETPGGAVFAWKEN